MIKYILTILAACIFSCASHEPKENVDQHLDSLRQAEFEQLKLDVEDLKKDVWELKEKDSINSRM